MKTTRIGALVALVAFAVLVTACGEQGAGIVSRQEAQDAVDAYNRGTKFVESSDLARAAEQFELAVQKNPNVAEAHILLGIVYVKMGKLDQGERSIKTGEDTLKRTERALFPGDPVEKVQSLLHAGLAELALARAEEAIADKQAARAYWATMKAELEIALRLQPTNPYALVLNKMVCEAEKNCKDLAGTGTTANVSR